MKTPFKKISISRHDLPSYEWKGCLAQEMAGKELVFVKFHQTKTEIVFQNDLPATNIEKKLKRCVPRSMIAETIVIGFPQKWEAIVLVDILAAGGKSVRGKTWDERLEMLQLMHSGFSDEGKRKFPLAKQQKRGVMKMFDDVVANGGNGLLLRLPGKSQVLFCRKVVL